MGIACVDEACDDGIDAAPALILLVAAYTPSRIRTVVRHPMLTAVLVWSFSHLLVNGDLASVILFGSFLAYAGYDIASASQRSALGPLGAAPGGVVGDGRSDRRWAGALRASLVLGSPKLTGVPLLP